MRSLMVVAAGVFLTMAVSYALSRIISRQTIWDYQKGLKYVNGIYKELLNPGAYWVFKPVTAIVQVDMRTQYTVVTGQEILSSDSISLKISIIAKYRVSDPVAATHNVQGFTQALYLVLQTAAREILGTKPVDELLEQRGALDKLILEQCEKEVQEFGLELLSTSIRDITFPGELKKTFAQVVQARKEGQAALERARGETAALRNLANAANLIQGNPMLLHLRAIQCLGQSSGNTLIMGMPVTEALSVNKKGESE